MIVAALFCRADSNYKSIPGVDVYDAERDARTYDGPHPVIAHPPCRGWGQLRHMAFKVRPDERNLARLSVALVREFGGVRQKLGVFYRKNVFECANIVFAEQTRKPLHLQQFAAIFLVVDNQNNWKSHNGSDDAVALTHAADDFLTIHWRWNRFTRKRNASWQTKRTKRRHFLM